jgi:signal transduction histidine kinase
VFPVSVSRRRRPARKLLRGVAPVVAVAIAGLWAAAALPIRPAGGALAGIVLLIGMAFYWAGERRDLEAEIARRREAEETAQQAQAMLEDAVESISEAFVIFDRDDRFVLCNETYRALYRPSAAALVPGTSFTDILRFGAANGQYPEAEGCAEEWIAERLRRHRELASPLEQRLAGGRHMLVTERRMGNGGIAGLRVDITRQKETELQLRQLTESLDRAQRLAHVGSYARDFRGEAQWSAEMYRIFGVDPQTFRATRINVMRRVVPADRPKIFHAYRQVARGICPAPIEHKIRRPNGELRCIYSKFELLCDDGGRVTGMGGTIWDITELRRSEVQLREMMDNVDRAQRLAHMGSYTRDLDGNGRWSAEVYRIFGVDPATFDPDMESFLGMVVPEDRSKVVAAHRQMEQGLCPESFEYCIRRPSGEIRYIHRIDELIRDRSGNVIGMGGMLWDITELRAAEERQNELERQLLHSQKLEALGRLAGGVAHDLNNTLVPILSLAKLALEDLVEDDPLHEDIATIVSASERARDLVKQILAFSRKQDIQKRRIDPATVLREALPMLRATLPSNIAFAERIDDAPAIFADPGQLQQVVVNLVTNAAQAIGAARASISIDMSTPGVGSGTGGRERCVRLRVADTGCGMEKAVLDRIFEPFFTTKPVGEGTGLGLSVVHGIVTGHGGTIEVKSRPRKGTVFTILLPVAEPATSALGVAA